MGASAEDTITAKLAANAIGSLASTASIAAPAGMDEPTFSNNSAITIPGCSTPVPALDLAGLALAGRLSAGIGAL